jgi:hypothetical protein
VNFKLITRKFTVFPFFPCFQSGIHTKRIKKKINSETLLYRSIRKKRIKKQDIPHTLQTKKLLVHKANYSIMASADSATVSKNTDDTHSNVTPKEEIPDCIICCDPIYLVALGKCNHVEACAICFMRRKVLCKDNQCPICKVIISLLFR